MKLGRDQLLLATRGRHAAFQAAWSDIKRDASNPDETLALARIRKPAKHRRIFERIEKVARELGLNATDSDALALTRSIDVAPYDFHLIPSADERTAVGDSRRLLANGTVAEGRRLWNELIGRARTARLGQGTIEVADLWRDLRQLFKLRGLPDYLSSWDRLEALTQDNRSRIESQLPSRCSLERSEAAGKIGALLAEGAVAIYGESGTGKSALVKAVLDRQFPGDQQVWLGPDDLTTALREAERRSMGIEHPLHDVLDASPHPRNILVIDAAERVNRQLSPAVKALIASLLARSTADRPRAWRIVIIGQTEAWISGHMQALSGIPVSSAFELKPLDHGEVRLALRSTDKLQWLAAHDDAISALTNLRALGWVIEAGHRFQQQGSAGVSSLTAIADTLWIYWTGGKPEVERLLMRLGEREATFEHSFALTDLDAADLSALGAMPAHCPLRRNTRNRYEFQHDLASDWARFQWLKQIADDTSRWAALASNPLWNGALRMLGQFLLRQREGSRSSWDIAFEAAEHAKERMPLAADILLDALCLDPQAEHFLNERADMLFANSGARLVRLLRRFEHIATVPGVAPELICADPSLSLYIEAQLRTPVFGRWPPVARFLTCHRARAAALVSPVISGLCERWLMSTPVTVGNAPTPYRKEFAELAYATAREQQFELAKHTMILGDADGPIYRAALLSAFELPYEIGQWALEMAQRRPLPPDLVAKLDAYRHEENAKHRERMKADPEYRKRIERKRSASGSGLLSSRRRLPPWPLGPQRGVDRRFARTLLHSGAGQALMRVGPAVASEVLLAAIVEGSPEESYSRRVTLDGDLGIEHDHEAYPTAYWRSPFYTYLQIDAEAALAALHQLIEFCTERWEADARREQKSVRPKITIPCLDGTAQVFTGNFRVFCWSQANSHHIGQLASALAALERWLCDLIDRCIDITDHIANLLRRSRSVAVLGVLVNVGKYMPELFKGSLKPLLALQWLYRWDDSRVDETGPDFFDHSAWSRQGQAFFELARAWVLAPHRRTALRHIVSRLIRQDSELAEFVAATAAGWQLPEGEKAALECRALAAQLNYRNYTTLLDPHGKETVEFRYPLDLQQAIEAFQAQHTSARQALNLPHYARRVLLGPEKLDAQQAAAVHAVLTAIDQGEANDLGDDMKETARAAAAATLLVKAPEWLQQHPAAGRRARAILDAAMAAMENRPDEHLPPSPFGQGPLEFVAHVVTLDWIASPSAESDNAVMLILTSGDYPAVQVLFLHAYQNRTPIGARWWRLLQLAVLWSGLRLLASGYDDDDAIRPRWQSWRARFRKFRLSGTSSGPGDINPLDPAKRIERFARWRWERQHADQRWWAAPSRRYSVGLDTHFLPSAFFWLLDDGVSPANPSEAADWAALVCRFWVHEAWCRTGSADDDDDEYDTLSQMGSQLVSALARHTLKAPPDGAEYLWRPVLELGPRGHYAAETFLTEWFGRITPETDVGRYAAHWRAMIGYVLGAGWSNGRYWHYGQRLKRKVLGFGSHEFIIRSPAHAVLVGSMRDLYKAWAENQLPHDEDNIAGFCAFLITDAGRPLRLDALSWIAEALAKDSVARRWYRDRTRTAFMEFLDVVVTEDAHEVRKQRSALRALIDLVAHAVAQQIPAALALQERMVRKF
jgi:hypothetical protein